MNRFLEKILRKKVLKFDYNLLNELAHHDMWSRLRYLTTLGFEPKGVVDAGAFCGDWTKSALKIFPKSKFMMIEAQAKMEPRLRELSEIRQGQVVYKAALLGSTQGQEIKFFDTGGTGSSIFEEASLVKKSETVFRTQTLDALLEGFPDPEFIKLDIQGAELEALKGAPQALKKAQFILMETSVMKYNQGAPSFKDVIVFMDDAGFEVFDFCDPNRMPRSFGSLFQMDLIFSKKDSKFTDKKFWL